MNTQIKDWLTQSRDQLDQIYREAKPGQIPQGDTQGTAIWAGGVMPEQFAGLARRLAWQGKVFDLFAPDFDQGVLVNKVGPFGSPSIVAKVYRDQSWLDDKDTIVIDYGRTSWLARPIRDEIREVSPGVYLGKVWWGDRRVLDFALETGA